MLWFSRNESDRYGWFESDGSIRSNLELDRFFETSIPLPEKPIQQSIVNIYNGYNQALQILREMNVDRESFRKVGLTFEEKAFYDILVMLRDKFNFEYGEDKNIDGVVINEKCRSLAKKIKEIIDAKSTFADWLNNQNVRDQLKFDIKICLVKNGYPPQYSPEVFKQVMEQVENFKENE